MSSEPIRVLVVDDHAVVREGIRHILEGEPGFVVVGEAGNGTDALRLAPEQKPDVGVRAGASGYLLKDSAAAELRLAVRAVHAGGSYFSTPAALGLSGGAEGGAG